MYPQFNYKLSESFTREQVEAMRVTEEERVRQHMGTLINWRPSLAQRKTQSGVPAVPLKKD